MPALTPTYLMDFESRMQRLTEQEYARFNTNLWWQKITKLRSTGARRDVVTWLLSTATIKDQGKMGGNIHFEDLVATYTEVEASYSGDGFKLRRAQLEDTDGDGLNLGSEWSTQIGAYMKYWPQKRVAHFLKSGHTTKYVGYDKLPFFAMAHPLNPFALNFGNFNNVFTGAAAGAYPGAVPLDESVTLDVALQNLRKIMTYIASLKMPNGEDPRYLRPAFILCSPQLYPRAVQLTEAKFFGQSAGPGGAGGSEFVTTDVEGLIKALGYATPVMVNELAGFENDTTYFVACENVTSSQLGAVVYTQREPFRINYYGTMDQAQLDRAQELEWHCIGRNTVSAGHPYLLYKCMAT